MQTIRLPELPLASRLTVIFILAVPILTATVIMIVNNMRVATNQGSWMVFIGVIAVFVVTGIIVVWAIRGNSITQDKHGLALRAAGFLKRRVNFDQVDWARAAIIDARKDPERGLRWRTFGMGMPGFYSGHFRLRNSQKCFAIVVGKQAVYLPLHNGEALILSMQNAHTWLRRHQSGD